MLSCQLPQRGAEFCREKDGVPGPYPGSLDDEWDEDVLLGQGSVVNFLVSLTARADRSHCPREDGIARGIRVSDGDIPDEMLPPGPWCERHSIWPNPAIGAEVRLLRSRV